MKNIIGILIIILIVYLLFSFVLADINFINWSENNRGYCSIYMILGSIMIYTINKINEK